jgi:SAM-dependent methyltransferase
MDQNKLSAIAHATHRFQSPVSVETLERVLAFAGLGPGVRVYDLGCGHAGMALHIAETHGADVQAVERSPLMAEAARRRIDGRGAPGRVTLHLGSAADFLAGAAPCDLLVAVGAVHLAGEASATETLRTLAGHVKPGGALLWGESCWLREPGDILRGLIGPTAGFYQSHAASVEAGGAAGLRPIYATTASDQEWDEYAWRYATAVEDHLRDHPDDPDAAALRGRVQAWRALYLHQARGVMGFGLYLFRT